MTAALAAGREWLEPAEVSLLLTCYGLSVCPQHVVDTVEPALAAAREIGYPVALKLAGGGIHKTEIGGVRLDLRDEVGVRRAFDGLRASSADVASAMLVQPMVRGTEVIVGVVRDLQFGPLVMLGAGGVLVDLLDDRTFRLAPLSVEDAASMIGDLRLARLLAGYRGAPVVSRAALADVLVRVAALAADLPEIAELDINPLVCSGDDLIAVDARIRVSSPPPPRDPLLRQLRAVETSAR